MIALESVSKRYGARTVVEDLSFEVASGEILGFLGPNGAGKTTTIRMISGFTTPSSGRIVVAGHDMAVENVDAARRIGYLPERPPLYDALTVREYLAFVARAKGIARGKRASELERVVGACRLEDVFTREVYKLSKGYRQRVGLAQAILGDPDVLLLDEPTAGLDPRQIHETREVIRGVGAARAVLLSSHVLSEVTLVCQRVAIIDHGRLLAVDTPAGLQRALEETLQVGLRVRTTEVDALREVVLAVSGVRSAVVGRGAGDTGVVEIVCEVDLDEAVTARIARAVAPRFDLLQLVRREPSLENVFLHYVRGDREPSAAR